MEQNFDFIDEKTVMPEDIKLPDSEDESQVTEVEKLDLEEQQNQVNVFEEKKEELVEEDLNNDGLRFIAVIFVILLVFVILLPYLVKLIG